MNKSDDKDGAGILFLNSNKILLGLRSEKVGNPGTWSVPGGKISKNDRGFWDAAARETVEELGFFPSNYSKKSVIRNKNKQGRRYVTFVLEVDDEFAESCKDKFTRNNEFDEIEWFELDSLPVKLHPKTRLVIEKHRSIHR